MDTIAIDADKPRITEHIMITVRIRMIAKHGKQQELKQTAQNISDYISREDGCLECAAYQEMSNPNVIIISADWSDEKAVEQHLSSNNIAILAGAQSILSSTVKVVTGFNEKKDSLQISFNKRFGLIL